MKFTQRPKLSLITMAGLLFASIPCAGLVFAQTEGYAPRLAWSRGKVVFERHCSMCHGDLGRGNGPAAYLLSPPVRDFSSGRFKLVSTGNGVPTDDDLVSTLKRGMPGSAMPSFAWMGEADLRALAEHVRTLAIDGLVARAYEKAEGEIDVDRRAELERSAVALMTPGEPIDIGHQALPTDSVLEEGERLFEANCAACHGMDGQGRPGIPRRDHDGTLNWARDLSSGVLKGGARFADLSRRIQGGMHGTAMPASEMQPKQIAALVAFVRSLLPEDANQRLVQKRTTIRASRCSRDVPAVPESSFWGSAEEVELALAPLWWHTASITSLRVSALHDGERVALRLRWRDPVPDAPRAVEGVPQKAPPYADGVALQLTPWEHPPLFGMGTDRKRTDLWHWKASGVPEPEALRELVARVPHWIDQGWVEKLVEPPIYLLTEGAISISGETLTARPAGMKIPRAGATCAGSVISNAVWEQGEWSVVLRRELGRRESAELPLRPGAFVSINFAVWNGAARDLRGQKSVSIWHRLELAP